MIESVDAAMATFEVVKTLVLGATPQRVWRALTDPKELVRWFPDEKAAIEAKPGSEGFLIWRNHGAYAVRFDVVEEPTRLVWTWGRESDVPLSETVSTTVEFRLERNEDGGTTLHVRETGFVREEDRRGNDEGWDKELGELVAYLESAG